MRDLNINELANVYGAGGSSCKPAPKCRKGSKSKHSGSKCKKSKSHKSNHRGTKGHC